MIPQREILWNIPSEVMLAVYIVSALCVVWISIWFIKRSRLWQQGQQAIRQLRWRESGTRLASYLLTHRVIRRDPYAGVMHALLFWGFIILLIATTLVGIEYHLNLTFLTGTTYLIFSCGADLGGVAFCAGLVMALWRRRTEDSHGRLLSSRETTGMLWLLLLIGLSGFLLEGARIAYDFPAFEVWSPVGYVTAKLLAVLSLDGERAMMLHRWVWIGHAILVGVFFVIIPITLLRHILVGAFSVAHPAGHPGVLNSTPLPYNASEATLSATNFRSIDLLQSDACLTCGRCNEVCPANTAGKPLQPRSIVLGLREMLEHENVDIANQSVSDNALWSCTTCNACDVACPVNINIVEKIVHFRRGRVNEANVPMTAVDALESTAQKHNPFGRPNSARMEWASGLKVPVAVENEQVDLLYWVGCSGAFDPAGREVARAMVRILNHLNVKYRVLGCRERCTGDPARRMGEEKLWQELAEVNQKNFSAHGVKTILTNCPHCLNAFRNEYPAIAADIAEVKVMHHSQWIQEQLKTGSLKLESGSNERLTFHDPCYLSRANDEVAAPRNVLDEFSGGQRVEMEQNATNSFCCGGGGGQMWLDVRGETRVENIRASHVEQTGAQTVATGCPFCRVMLEAGRSSLDENEGKWRVKDIAELVVENLDCK